MSMNSDSPNRDVTKGGQRAEVPPTSTDTEEFARQQAIQNRSSGGATSGRRGPK